MREAVFSFQGSQADAWSSLNSAATLAVTADFCSAATNLANQIIGYFRPAVPLALGLTVALIAILHVLLVGSGREMRRFVAPPHIAGVLHLKSFRNRALECFIRDNVDTATSSAWGKINHAVPTVVGSTRPQQAFVISKANSQQPFSQWQRCGILVGHLAPSYTQVTSCGS